MKSTPGGYFFSLSFFSREELRTVCVTAVAKSVESKNCASVISLTFQSFVNSN